MDLLKRLKITIWACMGISLLFSACNSGEPGLEMQIPKETAGIAVINTKSLFAKIAIDQLGNISMESIFGGSDTNRPPIDPNSDEAKWRELMNNPSQLGVDLLADAYFLLGEVSNATPSYVAIMLELSDATALEAYLTDSPPIDLQGDTQEGEKFRYRTLKDQSILAWDKKSAVLLQQKDSKGDAVASVSRIFNLPKDHAIASIDAFGDFMTQSNDAGVFINIKQWLSETPAHLMPMGLSQLPADYIGMHFDFDDGVANIKTDQYLSKQQKEIYNGMLEGVKLTDMFAHINMDDALGFANIRYTSQMIRQQIQENPLSQAQLASMLAGVSMSEEQFYSLFKGNLMVACTGMGMVTKEVIVNEMDEEFNMIEKVERKEVPAPLFLMAFETDVQGMKTLLEGLSKSLIVTADGSNFKVTYPGMENDGWVILLQDGKCVMTNQPNAMDETFSNNGRISDMANSAPMSIYIAIDKIIAAFANDLGRTGAEMRDFFSHVEVAVQKGSKDDIISSDLSLHLTDTERNSLLQLIAIIKKANSANSSTVPVF